MTTEHQDDLLLRGALDVVGAANFHGTVSLPAGTVTNAAVPANADMDADKLEHRHSKSYVQDGGADIVDATKLIHLARAAGSIKSIKARVTTAPTGGDKQFTVDVQKAADASGVWTSLMTGVITFAAAGSANDTLKTGVLIATPTFTAGSAIRVVIDASGATGSQGQGLIVEVNIDESGI